MKKLSIIFSISLFSVLLKAQTDTAYIYTYGGKQNDVCNQIKPTWDGGYIMIGTTNSFGCGNTDFYAIKIDSVGHKQWSNTYGWGVNEEGFSVAPTSDKGYAFVGFTDSYGNGGYDVLLVKTDSLGNVKWQKTYGGKDWDFGYSVQQLSDKGFVICGQTFSYGAGNGDVYVIRTDSVGDTLWTRTIGGTGYDIANMLAIGKDSTIGIIGATTSFGRGDTNEYFLLLDKRGNIKKDTTYGCLHSSTGYSIRETLDSGFIVFGKTDSIQPGKPDEWLIKTDSLGTIQWTQIEHSSGISRGNDAIQLKNGYYLAVSTTNSFGLGGFAMRVWELTSGGNAICGPSLGGTSDEEGCSIAVSINGSAVFAGSSNSLGYTEGLNDLYIVRMPKDTIVNGYGAIQTVNKYLDTCVCNTTSISSQSSVSIGVRLFPDPIISTATILVQGIMNEQYHFAVYDLTGQVIIKETQLQSTGHSQHIGQFNRVNLSAGIYFCKIFNQENTLVSATKFIVE